MNVYIVIMDGCVLLEYTPHNDVPGKTTTPTNKLALTYILQVFREGTIRWYTKSNYGMTCTIAGSLRK